MFSSSHRYVYSYKSKFCNFPATFVCVNSTSPRGPQSHDASCSTTSGSFREIFTKFALLCREITKRNSIIEATKFWFHPSGYYLENTAHLAESSARCYARYGPVRTLGPFRRYVVRTLGPKGHFSVRTLGPFRRYGIRTLRIISQNSRISGLYSSDILEF